MWGRKQGAFTLHLHASKAGLGIYISYLTVSPVLSQHTVKYFPAIATPG